MSVQAEILYVITPQETLFCNEILTVYCISTPFTAGQASSDRGTKHSISRMAQTSDVLPYPVVAVDKHRVLWSTGVATVD